MLRLLPSSRLPFLSFVLLLGALGLAAAGALVGAVGARQGCPAVATSDAVRLTVKGQAGNSLLGTATIDLAAPAALYVEYGNDQVGWLRSPTSAVAERHELALVRLRASTNYQVRAFALDDAGCPTAAAAGELTTGPMPPEFGKLVIASTGRSSYPLTVMDIRLTEDDLRWLVALDADWQPVWYYPIPTTMLQLAPGRGANGLIRHSNGNIMFLARNWGIEEIDPRTAKAVRRFRLPKSLVHHDLLELPNGEVLYIGAENKTIDDTPNGGEPGFRVRGDTLGILNLEADLERKVWTAFDHLDPLKRSTFWKGRMDEGAEEWTHGNSIALGARGNILVSLRHLDQVISLSSDFKTVEWKLGGPDSSFTFADPSDQFYAQHAVVELPSGNLLMFDNGNGRPEGDYSRALELELDFGTMTARKVWEYRHDPDIFSSAQSNAVRLPSGNTLVNFGYRDEPDIPVVLTEVQPDGGVVWEMTLKLTGQRATRYRVYPFPTLAGETAVEPTRVAGLAAARGS